jgi:hypothetical protein
VKKKARETSAWTAKRRTPRTANAIMLAFVTRLYSPAPMPMTRMSRVRCAPSDAVHTTRMMAEATA